MGEDVVGRRELTASRIILNATHEKALNKISMDELKAFAVDK